MPTLDDLRLELSRASGFNKASQTQLTKVVAMAEALAATGEPSDPPTEPDPEQGGTGEEPPPEEEPAPPPDEEPPPGSTGNPPTEPPTQPPASGGTRAYPQERSLVVHGIAPTPIDLSARPGDEWSDPALGTRSAVVALPTGKAPGPHNDASSQQQQWSHDSRYFWDVDGPYVFYAVDESAPAGSRIFPLGSGPGAVALVSATRPAFRQRTNYEVYFQGGNVPGTVLGSLYRMELLVTPGAEASAKWGAPRLLFDVDALFKSAGFSTGVEWATSITSMYNVTTTTSPDPADDEYVCTSFGGIPDKYRYCLLLNVTQSDAKGRPVFQVLDTASGQPTGSPMRAWDSEAPGWTVLPMVNLSNHGGTGQCFGIHNSRVSCRAEWVMITIQNMPTGYVSEHCWRRSDNTVVGQFRSSDHWGGHHGITDDFIVGRGDADAAGSNFQWRLRLFDDLVKYGSAAPFRELITPPYVGARKTGPDDHVCAVQPWTSRWPMMITCTNVVPPAQLSQHQAGDGEMLGILTDAGDPDYGKPIRFLQTHSNSAQGSFWGTSIACPSPDARKCLYNSDMDHSLGAFGSGSWLSGEFVAFLMERS